MKLSFRSYTAYSIGCAVAWAIILISVRSEVGKHTAHTFNLLFFGWGDRVAIGHDRTGRLPPAEKVAADGQIGLNMVKRGPILT